MDSKVSLLNTIPAVDRSTDLLYIVDVSAGNSSNKVTTNVLLGITGNPVGTTDSQTLTNKTLTTPTISNPALSGTITGTYTLGGTPTFPASVVTLTGSQTLTNKTLTSPTINTPTISNATITANALTGFTTSNTGTVYGVPVVLGIIQSAGLVNSVNTAAIQSGAVDYSKVAAGFAIQTVSTNFSAVATGTTTIPFDNTIPQITEGNEYMTIAVTPKATTNFLIIEATALLSCSATGSMSIALFQDATTNALAAQSQFMATATGRMNFTLLHRMAAGTTSSTTFRLRAGNDGAGTTTFNGSNGIAVFGGVTISNMTVTEIKV